MKFAYYFTDGKYGDVADEIDCYTNLAGVLVASLRARMRKESIECRRGSGSR